MKTPAILLSLLLLAACSNRKSNEAKAGQAETPSETAQVQSFQTSSGQKEAKAKKEVVTPPEHVEVEHILIAFRGGSKHLNPRSREEAEALVQKILKMVKNDVDFAALAQKYSDDRQNGKAGGPYSMSNVGVAPRRGEVPRRRMVPAFGDVAFSLQVGAVGVAEYDPHRCPYGWHIIKRIR